MCPNIGSFTKCYNRQVNKQIRLVYFLLQNILLKLPPSLAALDDAQALRRKERRRGEPGEDVPRQYSTLCRHLTPTQPRHKDMRMDSTLNVTPEGSLSDQPTATGGDTDLWKEQQAPEAPEINISGTQPSTTMLGSNRGDSLYCCEGSTRKNT